MDLLQYRFRQRDLTRKIFASIFWLLTLAAMVMIFIFSGQSGPESQAVSDSFAAKFLAFLIDKVGINVIRKMAHFCEYMLLAFLVSSAYYLTFKRYSFIIPQCFASLYAVTDEVHQLFVPERAGRVFDVFVDSCGAAAGIAVFTLLLVIINYALIKLRKQ